ncbi:uncharacterized protein IL334_007913 [Kwoniella shivajii]|uniref:SUZ domain-containing protein n=1 Tax=Kwoniella shivajii TaxID=564305 RepID=A0ABZ1DA10_9TREE|nr:hypothetical protein IL334_007913 [Kwoniella shivajii]
MSNTIEEDDWETADITLSSKSNKAILPPSLRPQAASFQPRPSQPQSQPQSSIQPALHTRNQPTASSSRQPGLLQRRDTPDKVEEDDDWFRGNKPMSNRQIWDSANARPAQAQILSPQPIPGPKLQLLRRPVSSSPSSNDSSKGGIKAKTLEEREEEYRLARERIFGSGSGSRSGSGSGTNIVEDGLLRGGSSEGKSKSSRDNLVKGGNGGGNSGKSSPSITTIPKDRNLWDGLVPSQVRPSSSSSSSTNKTPDNRGGGGGVVRQPIGPGSGAGFGFGSGTGTGTNTSIAGFASPGPGSNSNSNSNGNPGFIYPGSGFNSPGFNGGSGYGSR